ncbi:right-handed parallel beta-helix repeat-containing protein [Rhodoligotrophos defluvii]|uniref:right-handed parallel beta-helix repeat-containing protein n=1 Tax=Rhodoligotrophos defluvii TaxID=2561934 RepID=UPI0010C9D287|nr:right-handed parallel beta-helix repeat-containing protein [Rhodoligotrophos defluvii]
MCDLSISGYADRNPELGDTKLVDVGPFDSAIFDRIEVSSSRNMALACVARYGTVSNSLFFRNLRDAINFTGSSRFHAEGNVIEECGDDAIACHIPRGTIGVYDSEVRIANNHIRKSFGIKVLGARNAAIVGNTLRLWYGYAIHIGSDANFEEGLAPKFGVTISGNSIIDGINSLLVGNVDRGAAIFISGSQGLGRGEDTISEYEDDSFFKYINRVGAEAGVPPSVGIMIIGNTMLQNWGDGGQFSEYGFGLLFTNKGYVNPHIPRRGGETSGVHITADTICVNLSSNIATGFTKGVSLSPSARLQDFAICGNSIVQCENGVVIDPQSRRLGGTVFSSGNNYNIDPFRVLASRVQDGSWSELGDKEGVAILIRGFDGFFSQGDSFQNCKTVIRSGGRASVVDARYIYDWSDGFKGLGEQPNLLSGRHFFAAMPIVGGDQLSYSSFDDSGFVLGANQMPQRGYFVEGQMIRSINRGEGSRRVLGWLRLTTGEAHQLGVDWAVISRE